MHVPGWASGGASCCMQMVTGINRMRATPGTPDQPLGQVYSAWLKQNPQFSQADVSQANLL